MKNINDMICEIIEKCNKLFSSTLSIKTETDCSRNDACSRLKLVLMQDRSGLSTDVIAKMRDELIEVISKYIEIDKEALDLNLASEGNSLALMASIPVKRARTLTESENIEENTKTSETENTEDEVSLDNEDIITVVAEEELNEDEDKLEKVVNN